MISTISVVCTWKIHSTKWLSIVRSAAIIWMDIPILSHNSQKNVLSFFHNVILSVGRWVLSKFGFRLKANRSGYARQWNCVASIERDHKSR